MADKNLAALTAASALTAADLTYVTQSGNSRKATGQQIRELVNSGLIETKTFDGTVGTYTFSGIPSTFTHLELIFVGRSSQSATTTQLSVQINGLSTSIYDLQSHFAIASSPGSGELLGSTDWRPILIAAANATASQAAYLNMTLHHYNQTTFYKTMDFKGRQANSTTTHAAYTISGDAQARTTNAITSITIFLASGNFVNGSVASLIGR